MGADMSFCATKTVSLVALVKGVVREHRQQLHQQEITVRLDLAEAELTAAVDGAAALREALTAVVHNAMTAMRSGGRLTLATGAEDAEHVTITVADTGPRVAAAPIGEPGSPPGVRGAEEPGVAPSLPLLVEAQRLLARHQGTLHVDTRADCGTTVTLLLPRARASADRAPQPA